MAQSVPIDAALGVARTGQAIGCIVYALDGTTVLTTFSIVGWYEAPAASGSFHHAGISLPDAGGVVAVGVSGTEYVRVSIEAAKALASDYTSARAVKLDNLDATISTRLPTSSYTAPTTPPTVAQIDTQLSGTHGSGGWATATGFATPSDVTTAQAAVTAAIAALNNLSSVQAQAAVAAALSAYSAATSTNVTAAQTAILAKLPAALSGGKMDSAISQLDTTAFSVALLNLIADHVLDRGAALNEASGVTTTKYSLYHMIMQILNGTMAGSTGTAYATDGSTAFTVPLTTDDAAVPVTGTH